MITAGVDIGSVATKAVIFNHDRVGGHALVSTGSRPMLSAEAALEQALAAAAVSRAEVVRVVSTGYGRRVVDFGERTITEIVACGLASHYLYPAETMPVSRTIIDLGGQDIKVIALHPDGLINDFLMNDKCAAGTGRFLEVMAQALEAPIQELSELALKSRHPAAVNSMCTVFAESEVISLLAQKVSPEDIVAGLLESIAKRISAMVLKLGLAPQVIFTGGGARCSGLVRILEQDLATTILVPEHPQYLNALGAALEARHP